ncbi:MAG TPA: LytTR family DNA-binding domain-containing protein [Caulobacteraceae bacterium]|jgi:DNA-binding LytR/AlgR family response regulator
MTMRVLLVDDEPLALDRLKVAFDQMTDVEVVGAAQDGDEAAALIATARPDLVILDIQMPRRSGMAVAAGLTGEHRPEVVFVTAFEHYAPDAFEVEAADYLLKPVRFDRLRQAVERARRRRALKDADGRAAELETVVQALRAEQRRPADSPYETEIWAPGRQGLVRVPVESIDWIEAARDYVLLHTSTRSHILRITMSALEKKLDPELMLRVHRSAFVRLDAVGEVQRPGKGLMTLVLKDGATVQVGPNYAHDVARRLRLDRPAAEPN